MNIRYFKEYSQNLGREMEFKLYGSSGKLCFAFPPQDGRFFDFENFGMVNTLSPWIESGRLALICPDSIDNETWSYEGGDPHERILLHEHWFRYITEELVPRVKALTGSTGKAIVTGCSMGGVHSGNFFFRRPDLFDVIVSLSGLFDASYFFHSYMEPLVYDNSPVHFLQGMPEDHPYMTLYRQSRIILCVGQGAWEDELLAGTRHMDQILRQKSIPAWVDYWGNDVSHDWCWWQKQLPYFFSRLFE